MIVLGSPFKTDNRLIEIPPFHTGHLGFVPGTEVSLYLISPMKEGRCNCEVIVTPLDRKPENIMQLTAVMIDKPGVVSRLLRAISDLSINILVEESSSINHLNHHHVNLLIDWSTSVFPNDDREVPPSTRRRYRDYHSVFPAHSMRCVTLFNSIMARCADVILWDTTPKNSSPRMSFRQIGVGRNENSRGRAVVSRLSKKKYFGQLELPTNLVSEIRQRTGIESDPRIPYLLLSDTEDRALRLFFPTEDVNSRLIHVAFQHNDLPGALAAITAVVARANLNILTSLTRKKDAAKSVWEAVLECPVDGGLPARVATGAERDSSKSIIEWLARQMLSHATPEDLHGLKEAAVEIAHPDYPPRKNQILFPLSSELQTRELRKPISGSRADLAAELLSALTTTAGSADTRMQREVLEMVIEHERSKPHVFVSYPRTASEHGDMVCEKIEDAGFFPIRYQTQDGTVILEEVLKYIERCDFFVGIWHPDDEGNPKAVSPWMPFEYGIAHALRRPCVVVHSRKLDKSVRQRISPEVAQAEYSDVRFESETCPLIIRNLQSYRSR